MLMMELEVLNEYLVKTPPRKENPSNREYTGRALVLEKKVGRATSTKGRTRTVPVALEYMGFPSKLVKRTVRNWDQYCNEEHDHRELPDVCPMFSTELVEERDYNVDEPYTKIPLWEPREYAISRILRPWDEYVEEQEIEAEIRRQEKEAREREEKERAQKNIDRANAVMTALDSLVPDHGLKFSVDEYRIDLEYSSSREVRTFEWWESFVEKLVDKHESDK